MDSYKFTYIDIIGIIAGLLIILSFIPQLITIIRNRSARDISILMYSISLIAQILWITYGILKIDLQIIITNVITSIITLLIIGFSLYFNS
jgi:MtN3 and saliva related transmembrane protein